MLFSNLLLEISNSIINNEVQLDWLGNIIKWLIESCGSIGLGIIIFTLILKLITLPFDIISRVSTKKNAIRMEKMRPQLEKLQRQYANNNQLYQKKMQELYKENGYSPFAACLPTLLNLIFFIVVIGQFSTYSNYANFNVFCNMSKAYVEAVNNYDAINKAENNIESDYIYELTGTDENGEEVIVKRYLNLYYYYNNSEVKNQYGFDIINDSQYETKFSYTEPDEADLRKLYDAITSENGLLKDYNDGRLIEKDGKITFGENLGKDPYENEFTEETFVEFLCTTIVEKSASDFYNVVIREKGREAAAEEYKKHDLSFLWVKNIWSQDLPWEHPVKSDFKSYNFVKSAGCAASCSSQCGGADNQIKSVSEPQYKELTANLTKQKEEPNGYLILVILSIGTMLLSQIVLNKSNKSQMELSTVDGENGTSAMTQKMMTWMMPIMFGFFSFMYTASFSIYMVVSSVFSLVSTLLINFFVEKSFEKLAAKEARDMELKRTGRIKEIEDNNKKKKK